MKIVDEVMKAVNAGENTPKKVEDFKISYVKTDGWGGYYEAKPTKKSKWVEIENDWMTGGYDDAGEHADYKVKEKLDRMEMELKKENKELAVIFLPTSNVFSTSYQVFSRAL